MHVVRDHIAWMKRDIEALLDAIPQIAREADDAQARLDAIRQQIRLLRRLIARYEAMGMTNPHPAEIVKSEGSPPDGGEITRKSPDSALSGQ